MYRLISYPEIWNQSFNSSKPFWDLYVQHIGPVTFVYATKQNGTSGDDICEENNELALYDKKINISEEKALNDAKNINNDYLEFIRITRKHQAERDRLKRLDVTKKTEFDEYYKDVSQVNTLVEDNLAKVPEKHLEIVHRPIQQEQQMIERYGSHENYEQIRSMEMHIDEHFSKKYRELAPNYWPAMPLNPKIYLNPISTD